MTEYFKQNRYVTNWTKYITLKVITDETSDIKNKQQYSWEKQEKGSKRQCENEKKVV